MRKLERVCERAEAGLAPLRLTSGALAARWGAPPGRELMPHRAAHGPNAPVLPLSRDPTADRQETPLLATSAHRRFSPVLTGFPRAARG